MDVMSLQENGRTASIRLTLESAAYDNERAETLRYTSESQRALHPGDAGLDQVPSLQEKPFTWNL
jgi:hypothetical protein